MPIDGPARGASADLVRVAAYATVAEAETVRGMPGAAPMRSARPRPRVRPYHGPLSVMTPSTSSGSYTDFGTLESGRSSSNALPASLRTYP